MSTPTTPLRSTLAAKAIVDAIRTGMSPTDLAVAVAVELGLNANNTQLQERIQAAARYFAELDEVLGGFSDMMDDARHDEQDKRWGEGGTAPGAGITHGVAALPHDWKEASANASRVEQAVQEAACDTPLAIIGNSGYKTRIQADARCPHI